MVPDLGSRHEKGGGGKSNTRPQAKCGEAVPRPSISNPSCATTLCATTNPSSNGASSDTTCWTTVLSNEQPLVKQGFLLPLNTVQRQTLCPNGRCARGRWGGPTEEG